MFVCKQSFYKHSKQTQFKWPNLQSFHPPTPKCFSKGTHALKTLPVLCFERVIRWTADPRIKIQLAPCKGTDISCFSAQAVAEELLRNPSLGHF